jgi:hypothetical protein
MKAKCRTTKLAAVAAALLLGAIGYAQANEQDTNITTVAYWKLAITNSNPLNLSYGVGVPDLATNVGQGTIPGTNNAVPPSVQDLWILGPMAGNTTYPSDVPPAAMFNPNNYFNAGSASWDCGADEYSGPGGEISCDNGTYGTNFNTSSFTEEVFFKTDYVGSNTPSMDTVKQTLIWNHKFSNYGVIQLNEEGNGTNDIGSLLFFSWNVVNFPYVRITAAQNGGERFDDGQWHYVCARYDGTKLTMDILVVNQDGTTTESSTYIGYPLNPGGLGSQGPFEIGDDEGGGTPFDGKINQVRFSSAALPAAQLIASANCTPAEFAGAGFSSTAATPSTNAVAVGASLSLTPVNWFNLGYPQGDQMAGGPLQFQWLKNGSPLPGQTNINLSYPSATVAASGSYQLVASTPCDGSITSATITVQVSQAISLALWNFDFVEDVLNPQATVDDEAPLFPKVYNLITFNNSPNNTGIGNAGEIPLTNSVPPTSMFINNSLAGTNSFDPSYLAGNDGVVFYPAGPDVFDFQTSFSLECFFRTYGDQSANGPMELVCQGSDGGNTFRYGVNLNQAGPGYLSFKINNFSVADPNGNSWEDTNSGIQSVVLNKNYADGNWHYLLAQYNSLANTIGLSVANTDSTGTNATFSLPVGYGPLPSTPEGNLFVGRYRYHWNDDNRNLFGALADVQVSEGLITPSSGQLGYLPVPPVITGISASGSTVTITFIGAPGALASSYSVVSASSITGSFGPVSATVTSLGSGNFQATLTKIGSAQYYKIKY